MQERIGIIDLGSNTTRLIVMAYEPGRSFRMTDEVSETVRLAEGVKEDGILQPAAMYRTVEALKTFHGLCRGTDVQYIKPVATSALREASNQAEFLHKLKQETGLDIRILSGQEEAYYGYLGVVNSMSVSDAFTVDIGGGSTEITQMQDRQFTNWVSYPVGTVRFTERYVNSDPISTSDFRSLNQAAADTFASVEWLEDVPGHVLVGMGGTVRNLARIDQKRRRYPMERLHGYVMTRKALEKTIAELRKNDLKGRASISGLNRDRADVILAGAVILHQVMLRGNFDRVHISGQGLRDGLFYEHFLGDKPEPLFENVRDFSVRNLANLYNYEAAHVNQVRHLSLEMFDLLQPLHGYGDWERELLGYAAMLHDIGVQVGYYDHHKHSAYVLVNTSMPGFSHREIALLTILVRSHRKGDVKTSEYSKVLQKDDSERAAKLAAMLRLAEYMERSKSRVVDKLSAEFENSTVRLRIHTDDDATVEIWNANRKTSLFEKAFGRTLEVVGAEDED
jgi:exopolyphosphatase/guanosine-5'-triphosphate,3'-diphosphate pyrophosphatase